MYRGIIQGQSSIVIDAAGRRRSTRLAQSVRTHAVHMTLGAQLDVTTAGTLRNRGSVAALFDEVGVMMDGKERIVMDARQARAYMAAQLGANLRPATRAADGGTGTTQLQERVTMFFALPSIANPDELAILERNITQNVEAFAKYNGLFANLVSGAGAGSVSNPTVLVHEDTDPFRQDLPLFRPIVRSTSDTISASSSAYRISLKGSRYITGILIQQDSDLGEVSDIISTVRLLGGNQNDIIPDPISWAELVGRTPSYDGATSAYAFIDFLDKGRLSRMLNPAAYPDLRLELGVAPSASANGKVNVVIFEAETDPQLTRALPPQLAAHL